MRTESQPSVGEPSTLRFAVEGMSCGHCVSAITEHVGGLPGVNAVDVDLDRERVDVLGTNLDVSAIVSALDDAGFTSRPD